jgi:conjugative transfer signal peptidase TraF
MIVIKDRKPPIVIGLIFLALFGVRLGIRKPVFYLNLSPSEPIGLYWVVTSPAETVRLRRGQLTQGDLVVLAPPPKAWPYVYGRGWLSRDSLLLKTVVALPGDQVDITDRAIYINQCYIGPIKERDRVGLPLPKLRGRIAIPEGCFLPLATRVPNSFDGRYFGPAPVSLVKHVVRPVLVWR